MRKPKCPYCGTKLNYAKSFALKRHGEYICPKCGGLSNVRLDPGVYVLGFLAIFIAACFFAAGLFLSSDSAVWTIPGAAAPFVLFYFLSAFFVRLRKPQPPRVPQTDPGPQEPRHSGASLRDMPPPR